MFLFLNRLFLFALECQHYSFALGPSGLTWHPAFLAFFSFLHFSGCLQITQANKVDKSCAYPLDSRFAAKNTAGGDLPFEDHFSWHDGAIEALRIERGVCIHELPDAVGVGGVGEQGLPLDGWCEVGGRLHCVGRIRCAGHL